MELFKLKRMDPVREAQLAELARIKQKLEKEKVAESERIEQERREEIKKCQEKKGTCILLTYFLGNFVFIVRSFVYKNLKNCYFIY